MRMYLKKDPYLGEQSLSQGWGECLGSNVHSNMCWVNEWMSEYSFPLNFNLQNAAQHSANIEHLSHLNRPCLRPGLHINSLETLPWSLGTSSSDSGAPAHTFLDCHYGYMALIRLSYAEDRDCVYILYYFHNDLYTVNINKYQMKKWTDPFLILSEALEQNRQHCTSTSSTPRSLIFFFYCPYFHHYSL